MIFLIQSLDNLLSAKFATPKNVSFSNICFTSPISFNLHKKQDYIYGPEKLLNAQNTRSFY